MIVLVSGATVQVRQHPNVGVLVVPGAGNAPESLELSRPHAFDNGAFSGLDVPKFLRMLKRFAPHRNENCLFVTAPDVVADASATMDLFTEWEPVIHAWGFPVAFVGQDGLDLATVPWDSCEAVFLGGTTAWKLGSVARDLSAYANARGKWVHMGRVNSAIRMRYGMKIGINSIDGRQWNKWSRRYLPKIAPIVSGYRGGPLFATL